MIGRALMACETSLIAFSWQTEFIYEGLRMSDTALETLTIEETSFGANTTVCMDTIDVQASSCACQCACSCTGAFATASGGGYFVAAGISSPVG